MEELVGSMHGAHSLWDELGEYHMAAVYGIGSEEMQSRKAPWQGVASFA